MRRFFALVAGTLALLLGRPASAGDPAVTAEDLLAHVRTLASDAYEGRGSGTPGEAKAADYVGREFARIGLEPLGKDETPFQTVEMAGTFRAMPACKLELKGAGAPLELALDREWLPLSATADGDVTAEVVFAGYGIRAPELKYDDYAGLDVKGKIVVVFRNTPEGAWWADRRSLVRHAPLVQKLRHAADLGARAVIVANDPRTFGEGKGGAAGARPDAAVTDEIGARLAGIPFAHMTLGAAERLFPAAFGKSPRDLEARINDAEGAKPASAAGSGTMHLVVRTEREVLKGRNVCALLRAGAPDATDEVVVVGAHHDHLGKGLVGSLARSPEERGEIHNGADDNASGVAGVLEAAEYLAARKAELRRSVLFVTFTGEERGLLGSLWFVEAPPVPLSRVAAMVNLDMIGRLGHRKLFVGGVGTSPGFHALVESCAREIPVEIALGDGGRAPSDNTSFYAKRIPVLWLFSGMHPDYHRPGDDVEKIDAAGMERAARLAARLVEQIAKEPVRPSFTRADTGGEPPRAVLGIVAEQAEGGIRIGRVQADVGAGAAGLRAGDVIVAIDGEATSDLNALREVLFARDVGDRVKVKVRRGEEDLLVDVVLARGGG
ncbi:MAG TPA: M20/M25/M40 family metallo-hydrolase [Planctomycetota bacterium]|nr:M20/M25/M40 family metallo-hydrolase [Planctomycetota bacterium]